MTDWSPPIISRQIETHYRGWWLANLIAIDMLANTLIGGRPGETISSRFARNHAHRGWTSRLWWPRSWIKHCYWAAGYEPPPREARS